MPKFERPEETTPEYPVESEKKLTPFEKANGILNQLKRDMNMKLEAIENRETALQNAAKGLDYEAKMLREAASLLDDKDDEMAAKLRALAVETKGWYAYDMKMRKEHDMSEYQPMESFKALVAKINRIVITESLL